MAFTQKVLPLILLSICFACKKDVGIIPENAPSPEVSGEAAPIFKKVDAIDAFGNGMIRNASRAGDGFVYFVGYRNGFVYDSATGILSSNAIDFIGDNQVKPTMTSKYFTRVFMSSMLIVPHNSLPGPPFSYSGEQINFEGYDADFSSLQMVPALAGPKTLLVKYGDNKGNQKCLAFKLEFPAVEWAQPKPSFEINITDHRIFFDSNGVYNSQMIGAAGKNLLFGLGIEKTYLLTENLDTVFVCSGTTFGQLFEYGGTYYAFGFTKTANGASTCLLQSTDEGYHWNVIVEGLSYDLLRGSVVTIGDRKLFYSLTNQLWELQINGSSLSIRELDNKGLPRGIIINAVTFLNNKVFVCTETGVFEKPLSSLF